MTPAVRILLLLAVAPACAGAVSSARHAFPGRSTYGPTGMVLGPPGQVVQADWYAAGLHRGALKSVIGILSIAEIGFALPDVYEEPNRRAWLDQSHGFVKMGGEFMPSARWFPGLAVGVENSAGWLATKAGIKNKDLEISPNMQSLYAVGTWWWSILSWPVEASAGAGTGRFEKKAFGALSFIPVTFFGNTLKFTGEYAGREGSIGARFALSRTLRLDFAMILHAIQNPGTRRYTITIDRGIMGASTSGPIWWGFLKGKPKESRKP